jgi:iron complex outermembrane receptor protein
LNPDAVVGYQGAWFGTEVRFRWDMGPTNRLFVGLEAQSHPKADVTTQVGSDTPFGGNFTYHGLSLYVQDEWQLTNRISVTGGVRADWLTDRDLALAPRVAFVLHPTSSSTAKILYGEAFRHPQALEMELHAPRYSLVGNPFLRPERIQTAELAWEQRLGGKLFARASGFYSRVRDLTEQVLVDSPDSLVQFGPAMLQYNNVARERVWSGV